MSEIFRLMLSRSDRENHHMFVFFKEKRMGKLLDKIRDFIKQNYEQVSPEATPNESASPVSQNSEIKYSIDSDLFDATRSIHEAALQTIKQEREKSFVDQLLLYIQEKDLYDPDVYRAAQIDRRLFSKIVSDRTYTPSKDTCIALCLALKLTIEETRDMLERAGHALSRSITRDIVIEYLIRNGICKLNDVNEILFRLDEKQIGR